MDEFLLLAVLLAAWLSIMGYKWYTSKAVDATSKRNSGELDSLHVNYLVVYFLAQLADWLQGTNMYTLYQGYGVSVANLFLSGFLSSAIFGTYLGAWVDDFGRKRSCLVYCFLEVVIQILEHFPNFYVLLAGRIMGGISTSLLFCSFESWLVSSHRKKGLSEESLTKLFSYMSVLNGIAAILAGLIARVSFNMLGDIGPFQIALGLTVLIWIIIGFTWEENYGQGSTTKTNTTLAMEIMYKHPSVFAMGMIQSVFDGAMFTFVFMWVPTLQGLNPYNGRIPTEIIFSCLMASITVGGSCFDLFPLVNDSQLKRSGLIILLGAAASMLAPVFSVSYYAVVLAFCMFEICVGIFNPWCAKMRSLVIPADVMATMITLWRLPLNIIVVSGVYISDNYPPKLVFCGCSVLYIGCALALYSVPVKREKNE